MSEYAGDVQGMGGSVKAMMPSDRDRGNIESLTMEISDALNGTHELIAQLEDVISPFLREDRESSRDPNSQPTPPMSNHAEQLRKNLESLRYANDRLHSIRQRVDL